MRRRDEAESVGYLVAMVRRRMNLLFSEALQPYRLTTRQFGVLSRLWRADGQTVEQLTTALYTDQSSLSRVVDRMVRNGLVTRRPDRRDRRARRVCLTARGRALARPIERVAAELDRRIEAGLGARAGRLKDELRRVLLNLSEISS